MSLVTIRVPRTNDEARLQDIIKALRLGLRKARDAGARKSEFWRVVQMSGYVQVGAVRESDIQFLPPGLKESILSSPVDGHSDTDPVWLPHLHVIVRHDNIGRGELSEVLGRRFPDVHVEPFYPSRTLDENVQAIMEYMLKRSGPIMFDGGESQIWPIEWVARFYVWLHRLKSGAAATCETRSDTG